MQPKAVILVTMDLFVLFRSILESLNTNTYIALPIIKNLCTSKAILLWFVKLSSLTFMPIYFYRIISIKIKKSQFLALLLSLRLKDYNASEVLFIFQTWKPTCKNVFNIWGQLHAFWFKSNFCFWGFSGVQCNKILFSIWQLSKAANKCESYLFFFIWASKSNAVVDMTPRFSDFKWKNHSKKTPQMFSRYIQLEIQWWKDSSLPPPA